MKLFGYKLFSKVEKKPNLYQKVIAAPQVEPLAKEEEAVRARARLVIAVKEANDALDACHDLDMRIGLRTVDSNTFLKISRPHKKTLKKIIKGKK